MPGTSSPRRLALPPGCPGNGPRGRGDPAEEAAQGRVGAGPRILLGGDGGAGTPRPHIVLKVKAVKQGGRRRGPRKMTFPGGQRRAGGETAAQVLNNFMGHADQPCLLPNNKIPPSVNAQVSSLLLPSKAQSVKPTHRGPAERWACLPFPWRAASFARSPVSLSSGSQRSSGVQLSGNRVRGCVLAKYSSAAHF